MGHGFERGCIYYIGMTVMGDAMVRVPRVFRGGERARARVQAAAGFGSFFGRSRFEKSKEKRRRVAFNVAIPNIID